MIRALYSLVMWLAQPFLRAKLRRRARGEPGYGVAIDERFGYYTQPAERADKDSAANQAHAFVWVHAVSLGEARAATALVAQLRQQLPGMRLLLTHGTATGRTQGGALLQPGDVQVWQPWDSVGAVARFLAHFRPRVGLLVETEVWPNMVTGCALAGTPLCLVNARLSDKSLQQAMRLSWLSCPAYAGLRAVWAQSQEDAIRLQSLGAQVHGVMGNFKYDLTPDPTQLAQGDAWHAAQVRPVVMFASSREGEEAMLLNILNTKRVKAPAEYAQTAINSIASSVQWLIVPRHPQRFDAVTQLVLDAGFTVSRRSLWQTEIPARIQAQTLEQPHTAPPQDVDVWVGDTLGEMALYFGLADVVLLGGSFAPLGGQNLIEAAACGCPVVMGPHTFNFAQAAALAQAAGAAFELADMGLAVEKALQLLQSRAQLEQAQLASLRWSQAHCGAAERTALAVKTLLLG